MTPNPSTNGRGAGTSTPDVEVLPPEDQMQTTGHAFPIGRVHRKEVVWGVVGFGAGVALTLVILRLCSKSVR